MYFTAHKLWQRIFISNVITKDDYINAIRSIIHRLALFLRREPFDIWNNSFAKTLLKIWKANTNAQFVLNAYAATMHCNSYMTKVDRSMTSAFKRICEDHEKNNIDAIKMISKLGNELLNLQQMSSQQGTHIILSLPLNYSSRKCVFIDIRAEDDQTFVPKQTKQLDKELDDKKM